MDVVVEHQPGRFVARIDGEDAVLVYERDGDVLDLVHTFTPPRLRGRNIAAALTAAAVAYAQAERLKIRPTCSYTDAYFALHPELAALRAFGGAGST